MVHPIIINSSGNSENLYPNGFVNITKSLKKTFRDIFNHELRPSKIIMNEADYKDILIFAKENS